MRSCATSPRCWVGKSNLTVDRMMLLLRRAHTLPWLLQMYCLERLANGDLVTARALLAAMVQACRRRPSPPLCFMPP